MVVKLCCIIQDVEMYLSVSLCHIFSRLSSLLYNTGRRNVLIRVFSVGCPLCCIIQDVEMYLSVCLFVICSVGCPLCCIIQDVEMYLSLCLFVIFSVGCPLSFS